MHKWDKAGDVLEPWEDSSQDWWGPTQTQPQTDAAAASIEKQVCFSRKMIFNTNYGLNSSCQHLPKWSRVPQLPVFCCLLHEDWRLTCWSPSLFKLVQYGRNRRVLWSIVSCILWWGSFIGWLGLVSPFLYSFYYHPQILFILLLALLVHQRYQTLQLARVPQLLALEADNLESLEACLVGCCIVLEDLNETAGG